MNSALVVGWLAASSAGGTATAADEIIIIDDGRLPTPSLSSTLAEDSSVILEDAPPAAVPSFFDITKARANFRVDARFALDTSFERKGEQIAELWLGARLELDLELSDRWAFYAAPRFDYVTGISREGDDRQLVYALFPEAQLTFRSGPLLVRAGSLLFTWGSSDLVSPIDVLNPFDLRRNLLGFGQDTKIPVLAAEVVGNFGPLTIRGVVQPFFTASRYQVTGWDFSVLQTGGFPGADVLSNPELFNPAYLDRLGDEILVTDRPRDRPDNATLAARATLSLGELELSVSAIHGWDTLPRLILDQDLIFVAGAFGAAQAEGRPPPFDDSEVVGALGRLQRGVEDGRTLLRGSYLRRDLIGLDGSYALDPFVFKFDVAYTFKRTMYDWTYRPTTIGWLSSTLGVEYFYGDNLQVIVEGFVQTAVDIESNVRLLYLEANTPPPSRFIGGFRTVAVPGVVALVRYLLFDGDLALDLAVGSLLTRGDLALIPTITWRVDDHHQVALSGALLEGQSDSYGGFYSNTDQVSVSYRLSY